MDFLLIKKMSEASEMVASEDILMLPSPKEVGGNKALVDLLIYSFEDATDFSLETFSLEAEEKDLKEKK